MKDLPRDAYIYLFSCASRAALERATTAAAARSSNSSTSHSEAQQGDLQESYLYVRFSLPPCNGRSRLFFGNWGAALLPISYSASTRIVVTLGSWLFVECRSADTVVKTEVPSFFAAVNLNIRIDFSLNCRRQIWRCDGINTVPFRSVSVIYNSIQIDCATCLHCHDNLDKYKPKNGTRDTLGKIGTDEI